tara:strand:- start:49 stop:222 length:174 start_codon:yes stop_codon:yes gene_type:complete
MIKFTITKIQTSILTCEVEAKDFDEVSELVDSNNLDFEMQYDGTIYGNEEIQIDEVI